MESSYGKLSLFIILILYYPMVVLSPRDNKIDSALKHDLKVACAMRKENNLKEPVFVNGFVQRFIRRMDNKSKLAKGRDQKEKAESLLKETHRFLNSCTEVDELEKKELLGIIERLNSTLKESEELSREREVLDWKWKLGIHRLDAKERKDWIERNERLLKLDESRIKELNKQSQVHNEEEIAMKERCEVLDRELWTCQQEHFEVVLNYQKLDEEMEDIEEEVFLLKDLLLEARQYKKFVNKSVSKREFHFKNPELRVMLERLEKREEIHFEKPPQIEDLVNECSEDVLHHWIEQKFQSSSVACGSNERSRTPKSSIVELTQEQKDTHLIDRAYDLFESGRIILPSFVSAHPVKQFEFRVGSGDQKLQFAFCNEVLKTLKNRCSWKISSISRWEFVVQGENYKFVIGSDWDNIWVKTTLSIYMHER